MPSPSAAVQQVFEGFRRYLHEYSPTATTALGDHSRDGDLDDWSPDGADERLRALRGLRSELDAVSTGLDAGTDGDRTLLADAIDAAIFELSGLRTHARDPLHYLDLATSAVYDLVRRDDLDPEPRQRAVAQRAALVPRLLSQARANLDEVPAPHRAVALQRLPGAVALFREVLPAFAPRAADAGEQAGAACEAFGTWLEEQGEPSPDWRLGPETWADALRLVLGVRMSPEELWARAQEALPALHERAEELAAVVVEGDTRGQRGRELILAGLDVCARDHSARDRLVQDAAAALDEIRAFLRETGEFDLPELDSLRVEEVPAFQQGVAVAFFVPAPPLETAAPHTYYLSPLPAEWDEERATSFLREYNHHALRSVGIHEAYPGHYVQLASAQRHPRLLRRALWNSAFAEGWAVYVEHQVVGAGFGGDEATRARLQLVSTKLDMRQVANALLDQGLHVHGWDDAKAMGLMVDETFQERSEADGKLVRGKVTAGQLSSYFVGAAEMDDLRRDCERAWGAQFSPLRFHRAVLAEGTPPFPVLRRALLGS